MNLVTSCVSADVGSGEFTGARFGAEAEKMRHEEVDLRNFRIQNDPNSFKVTKLHVTAKTYEVYEIMKNLKCILTYFDYDCGFFQALAVSRRFPDRNHREFELWARERRVRFANHV